MRNLITQFLKFCLVGGIGAIIHLSILYSLTEWAGTWYMASAIVATFFAACFNFTGNKLWTFHKPIEDNQMPADYDWKAYWKGNPIQRLWKRRLNSLVIKWAIVGNPVYDIGCGSSPLLSLMPLTEKHGLDLNGNKIAFIRRVDRSSRYLVGDALQTGFPTGVASTTMCVEVIEHVDKPHKLVEELTRITKPGGTIIIATPDFASWRWNIIEVLYGIIMRHGYHGEHRTKFTESSLVALGESYGLYWIRTEKVFGADMVVVFQKS